MQQTYCQNVTKNLSGMCFLKNRCNVMFFRKDMFSPTWPCSCILAGPTRNVHSCICFSTSYPYLQRQLNMIVINCLVLVANHRSGLNCLVLVLPHAKKFFIWPRQILGVHCPMTNFYLHSCLRVYLKCIHVLLENVCACLLPYKLQWLQVLLRIFDIFFERSKFLS